MNEPLPNLLVGRSRNEDRLTAGHHLAGYASSKRNRRPEIFAIFRRPRPIPDGRSLLRAVDNGGRDHVEFDQASHLCRKQLKHFLDLECGTDDAADLGDNLILLGETPFHRRHLAH